MDIINSIIHAISSLLQAAVSLLPSDPFSVYFDQASAFFGKWTGWLNWFLPVHEIAVIFSLYVTVSLVIRTFAPILRYLHIIKS